jgi:hypothetical protein
MDGGSLVNPRGPLPPEVYWRRRLALLGALVLVLIVAAYSCSRGDAKGATPVAKTSGAPPTTSPPSETPKPTPKASATPKATAKPTPTANPAALCPDAAIGVAATADRKRYGASQRPVLTLTVTNKGKVACTRDLGQQARELRLTSGNDRVWSSDDCSPGGTADRVVLKPGEKRTFTVTWSRRRSKPDCPGGQPVAKPGAYRVIGRLGKIEAPGTAFLIG